MAAMKLILPVCLFLVSCLGYTIAGCADCYRNHPQQSYCSAEYIFRFEVTNVTRYASVPGSSLADRDLIAGRLIDSWKSFVADVGESVSFYNPSSFCGTWFVEGNEYVVVVSSVESEDGTTYFDHASCDYDEAWDELSPRQQRGLELKYGRMCACTITPVRGISNMRVTDMPDGAGYAGALSYWTPTGCHYNPYKSESLKREDCEEQYGFCKPVSADDTTCAWQMTDDYERCFDEREKFVQVAENMAAITDISQCELLQNRRQRKRCRKLFKANAEGYESVIVVETGTDE